MPTDNYAVRRTDDQLADAYDFPVLFDFTGNWPDLAIGELSKLVHIGKDGQEIYTAPGMHVTVSTDKDGDGNFTEEVTLNITGTAKVTYLDDGNIQVDFMGRNLIYDSSDSGDPDVAWYKLAVGHFTWVGDEDGNTVVPLEGNGQLTDLDYFLA